MRIASVLLGGALGALARYAVGGYVAARVGIGFPYGTFIINITGSFALGVLSVLTTERALIHPEWRTFIGVGFLGAYTTFSSWEYETFRLIEDGNLLGGLMNLGASVAIGLAAVLLGVVLARWL